MNIALNKHVEYNRNKKWENFIHQTRFSAQPILKLQCNVFSAAELKNSTVRTS
jgi:hypothetical protein